MNKFIKIGLGCFTFLVLVAVALVIYLMNREIVGTPFGHPYIRLSTNEKALEERLSKECGCEVKLQHTYLKEDSDTLDFEFHVLFRWDISNSSFDSSTNVCSWDSSQVVTHTKKIAEQIYKIMSYQDVYSKFKVWYVNDIFNNDGAKYYGVCKKGISIDINKTTGTMNLNKYSSNLAPNFRIINSNVKYVLKNEDVDQKTTINQE